MVRVSLLSPFDRIGKRSFVRASEQRRRLCQLGAADGCYEIKAFISACERTREISEAKRETGPAYTPLRTFGRANIAHDAPGTLQASLSLSKFRIKNNCVQQFFLFFVFYECKYPNFQEIYKIYMIMITMIKDQFAKILT